MQDKVYKSLLFVHLSGQSGEQVKDRLEDPSALGAVSSTGPNGVTTPTSEWLYSVLLPKVVQWSEESQSGEVSRREPLVPLAKYCSLYGHLKEKYGPALIQVNVNTGMRQTVLATCRNDPA